MRNLRDEKGQMFVEYALLLPVVLILIIVLINLFWYVRAVVHFDQISTNAVLAHASSPSASHESNSHDLVRQAIEKSLKDFKRIEISVSSEGLDSDENTKALFSLKAHLKKYTCTLVYEPWPLSFGVGDFDAKIPLQLKYEKSLVIDPYRPGVVF
ncbi:MAG: hypothetical protein Q4E22_06670 [Coriobacteriia bacterium]|nr:hypothetical protein [Coriobacteriia bacterium]